MRRWFGNGFKSQLEVEVEEEQKFEDMNEDRRIRGLKPMERPKEKDKKESKE